MSMFGETAYETGRLHLEPLRGAHAAELFELLSDERLYRFIPQDPPASLAALEERYQRLETRQSAAGDRSWLNWVVRLKSDGRCVGRVEITLLKNGRARLAYEIGSEFWRRGIATEACARVIRALFEEGGVVEIVAEADTRNVASIHLLERLGFQRGEFRPNADFFKGRASDEWAYRLPHPAGDRRVELGGY